MNLMIIIVGVIIIAAVITVTYSIWLRYVAGYYEMDVPYEKVVPVASVHDVAGRMIGELIVYRERDSMPPEKLDSIMWKRASEYFGNGNITITPIKVTRDPGYGVFRVYHKNKALLVAAKEEWSSSIFHFLTMPAELFIRATLFPWMTLVDLVSHDRKMAACIVSDSSFDPSDIDRSISLVESYGTAFIKIRHNDD